MSQTQISLSVFQTQLRAPSVDYQLLCVSFKDHFVLRPVARDTKFPIYLDNKCSAFQCVAHFAVYLIASTV